MTRKLGLDISKYQVTYKPNAKASFVIMRTGYGKMPDKCFEDFYSAGKKVPKGAYHYFSSAVPWQEQVDFFLKQIDGKTFDWVALDMESYYNNKSQDFALCGVKWLETVTRETGIQSWIYTAPYFYRDWLRTYTDDYDRFPWWIAQYPYATWNSFVANIASTLTGKPKTSPSGREDWGMWQFTSKGDGQEYGVGSKYVDLNILNGQNLFIEPGPVIIPPVAEPKPEPKPEPRVPEPNITKIVYNLAIKESVAAVQSLTKE